MGVDLDGTLARYDGWTAAHDIGEPIQPMVDRVKKWLLMGVEVRIMTARVFPLGTVYQDVQTDAWKDRTAVALAALNAIEQWCKKHIGQVLPVTCIKDYSMIELWDDRAVSVIPNKGNAYPGIVTREIYT